MKKKGMEDQKIKSFLKPITSGGIARKLIISFILLSIIPLTFVGVVSYNNAKSTVRNKVSFYSEQMINQVVKNLDSNIHQLEEMSKMVIANKEILDIVKIDQFDSNFDKYTNEKKVTDNLSTFTSINNTITGMFIYKKNGTRLGAGSDTVLDKYNVLKNNEEIYEKLKEIVDSSDEAVIWITGLNDSYENIYLIRPLRITSQSDAGNILVMSINNQYINSLVESDEEDKSSNIVVLDKAQVAIGHFDATKIGTKVEETFLNKIYGDKKSYTFNEQGNIISYGTTSNGWKVVTKEQLSSLMREMDGVKWSILGIVVVCIIIAIIIGILISLSISKPLKDIMVLMGRAEKGDLTVHSNIKNKDEIGKLSKSFNLMIDNIRNLINETNNVVGQVENDTNIIKNSSEQSAVASEQVSAAINEMAEGSMEQAKLAENGYTLMEDLANNINHVTMSVESITNMLNKTEESRNYAANTMERLNEKTKDAVESTNIINGEISKLDKEAKEIITVVKAIEDISEQTNLLALNAAIEAARAGEAGKGFAVVAEEIRKLAMNSKDATGMISDIISRIQAETQKTVAVVKSSDVIFDEQNKIVNETNTAFNEMSESIQKVIGQIEDINTSIEAIQQKKDKSTEAMRNIVAIVEESSASIEEVTATSEEQTSSSDQLAVLASNLGQAIENLKNTIAKFEV